MGQGRRREAVTYLLTGIAGTLVCWSVKQAVARVLWHGMACTFVRGLLLGFIGWAVAVPVSYALSRFWVFRSKRPFVPEMLRFVRDRLLTMLFETLATGVLAGAFGLPVFFVSVLTTAIVMTANYFLARCLMGGGDAV